MLEFIIVAAIAIIVSVLTRTHGEREDPPDDFWTNPAYRNIPGNDYYDGDL